ncbi:class I SAM-dependent methyltransferase [Candidatus Kaiserbacteria bacterium]|nr:class I SAM-dependent methyltransferase [Candidatus Kaiserbacteria bacterium]
MTTGFNPHDVEWNEDKVVKFWNNRPTPESFAGTVAKGIIATVKRYGHIHGVTLDYGCGRGDFLEELLKEHVSVIAADNSEGVLRGVKERFSDKVTPVLITKPPLALKDGSVDYIFFNAVVEHLLPDTLDETLREFQRLLKPGGRVIVTCPYMENIAKYRTICPDCGGKFHYMQHVGSYSEDSLKALMEKHGFTTLTSEGSWLEYDTSIEARLKNIYHWIKRKMGRGQKFPHLIYVGKK